MAAGSEHEGQQREHASTGTYVTVFAVLFVLTVTEVGVFYIELVRPLLVSILLILSAAKFALVAMFFMHLKFDSKVFTALFSGPLAIAIIILLALLFLFGVFGM